VGLTPRELDSGPFFMTRLQNDRRVISARLSGTRAVKTGVENQETYKKPRTPYAL
jgi:hypothetical protein